MPATWTNKIKSSMSWTNKEKTSSTTFGELTPVEIGGLALADVVAGTTITLGEATPNTPIYTVWTNKTKSSTSWTNKAQS